MAPQYRSVCVGGWVSVLVWAWQHSGVRVCHRSCYSPSVCVCVCVRFGLGAFAAFGFGKSAENLCKLRA